MNAVRAAIAAVLLSLAVHLFAAEPGVTARLNPATGHVEIFEGGLPVLRYNYQTNAPGDLLEKVSDANRIYARARSDYIHPLYGLNGEELTKDWSPDHPHHRGIYWAWPEVDYGGQRGDLHALQRVFARPTGQCRLQSGEVIAQIEAENLWWWEDRDPIVREKVIIRAEAATAQGRGIDLVLSFTALKDGITLARRGTDKYGGLNQRFNRVAQQKIWTRTDTAERQPRRAMAGLWGLFGGGKSPSGVAIFQHPANPYYPGDWVQYPELNWLQPVFPAAGTRYALKKEQPLVLRYRLWVHRGGPPADADLEAQWRKAAEIR